MKKSWSNISDEIQLLISKHLGIKSMRTLETEQKVAAISGILAALCVFSLVFIHYHHHTAYEIFGDFLISQGKQLLPIGVVICLGVCIIVCAGHSLGKGEKGFYVWELRRYLCFDDDENISRESIMFKLRMLAGNQVLAEQAYNTVLENYAPGDDREVSLKAGELLRASQNRLDNALKFCKELGIEVSRADLFRMAIFLKDPA